MAYSITLATVIHTIALAVIVHIIAHAVIAYTSFVVTYSVTHNAIVVSHHSM